MCHLFRSGSNGIRIGELLYVENTGIVVEMLLLSCLDTEIISISDTMAAILNFRLPVASVCILISTIEFMNSENGGSGRRWNLNQGGRPSRTRDWPIFYAMICGGH